MPLTPGWGEGPDSAKSWGQESVGHHAESASLLKARALQGVEKGSPSGLGKVLDAEGIDAHRVGLLQGAYQLAKRIVDTDLSLAAMVGHQLKMDEPAAGVGEDAYFKTALGWGRPRCCISRLSIWGPRAAS